MKKSALLLFVCLFAGHSCYATQGTTVEAKKGFIKITEGNVRPDAPPDRDAPDILYIKKADVIRLSVVYSGRHTEFKVFLLTADDKNVMSNTARTYTYLFPNEASATAFCESILSL